MTTGRRLDITWTRQLDHNVEGNKHSMSRMTLIEQAALEEQPCCHHDHAVGMTLTFLQKSDRLELSIVLLHAGYVGLRR